MGGRDADGAAVMAVFGSRVICVDKTARYLSGGIAVTVLSE